MQYKASKKLKEKAQIKKWRNIINADTSTQKHHMVQLSCKQSVTLCGLYQEAEQAQLNQMLYQEEDISSLSVHTHMPQLEQWYLCSALYITYCTLV